MTFDLMTLKVDCHMPLPLDDMLFSIKISSFVFKILCSRV